MYLRHRRSIDGGVSFGSTVNLSMSPGLQPSIAASGNNVYVLWRDHGSGVGAEILFRVSVDGGFTFGRILILSNANDGSAPHISVFGT